MDESENELPSDENPPWEEDDQDPGAGGVHPESEESKPHSQTKDNSMSEYDQVLAIVQEHRGFSMEIVQRKLRISYAAATRHIEQMLNEGIIGPYDKDKKMRPLILDAEAQSENERAIMLEKMKRYMCEHRSAKSSELREVFSIRKEKVLEYMQQLADDGFLHPPENARAGYSIAWTEDLMQAYLNDVES